MMLREICRYMMRAGEKPATCAGFDVGQRTLGQRCPPDEPDISLHVEHGDHRTATQ